MTGQDLTPFHFPTEDITEGNVKITIPSLKIYAKGKSEYIPSKTPVFYNPRMTLNRDIAVLALQTCQRMLNREARVCEPLAGCGVRGIRFASEVEGVSSITINDLNPYAAKLARFNVEKNGLSHKIVVEETDANFLMNKNSSPERRFDAIDVDPYGSSSPFVDSALRALRSGGIVALTATDMAPLCGVHPQACTRKYFAKPIKTEYCHELAVRIMTSFLALSAAKYELGIKLLFSHSTYHYIRVYAQVNHSLGAANEAIEKIGYILHCPHCLNREWLYGFVNTRKPDCSLCGREMRIAGPLWLGELSDTEFCRKMLAEGINRRGFEKASRLIGEILGESDAPPTYYVLDKISEKLGTSSPGKDEIIQKLVEAGFKAVPTHFNPKGIKSNASINAVKKTIKDATFSQSAESS